MQNSYYRYLTTFSALICALSVALSAYAMHGLEGDARARLLMATCFAFIHGLSIITLVRPSANKSNSWACSLMLLGIILFSGSLIANVLWHTSTALAPMGGSALIAAWCWTAVNFFLLKKQ